MSPINYRDATWRDIQGRLCSLRASVYEALLEFGPCTTRELTRYCDIDLLSIRPRMTELVQLGFAECLDNRGTEGTYRALTATEAEAVFAARKAAAQDPQTLLAL